MKAFPSVFVLSSASFSSVSLSFRYAVYIGEVRKRLIYIGLSLCFAFACAYIKRVNLMYLITLSLQKALLFQKERKKIKEVVEVYYSSDNQESFGIFSIFDFLNQGWDAAVLKIQSARNFFPPYFVTGRENESVQQEDMSFLPFYDVGEHEGEGVRLIFTDIEEAFYTFLFVSLFWCLLACIPVIAYHIWCFVQPGIFGWQSKRARFSLLTGLFSMYLILWVVDQSFLPRLLSFFYSFEIERTGLILCAETKIFSYVSLYVLINSIALTLFLLTSVWRLYRQKHILNSLLVFYRFSTADSKSSRCLCIYKVNTSVLACCEIGCVKSKIGYIKYDPKRVWRSRLRKYFAERKGLSSRYQSQRSKVWWGCLLVSALVSPPEVSSQLFCACVLIFCVELAIWLSYTSASRLSDQMCNLPPH